MFHFYTPWRFEEAIEYTPWRFDGLTKNWSHVIKIDMRSLIMGVGVFFIIFEQAHSSS